MQVKELIELLKTYPEGLEIVYQQYSEHCLMDPRDITIETLSTVRPDGWVHDKRPDRPRQQYVVFPGN
jgi:hypothetical protein